MNSSYKKSKIDKNKKAFSFSFFIFFLILFFQLASKPALAEENSALALLQKMNQAVNQLNYQVYFISQGRNQASDSFEYHHLGSTRKNEISARLSYLEGPSREIILHNGITSYFQSNNSSFSIPSSRIAEAFPDIVYNDLSQLADVYDFILLGKMRTANRSAEIIKVVPKNKDRYSYIIWIDAETSLPLRIDLLDLNNELIQQLKVINLNLDFDRQKEKKLINDRQFPILLAIEKQKEALNKWQLSWLPLGFNEVSTYNVSFYRSDTVTKFYTDGVFSFAITISDANLENNEKQPNRIVVAGERTILSSNTNNADITIIGDLPLVTIERIVQNIVQKTIVQKTNEQKPIQKSQ